MEESFFSQFITNFGYIYYLRMSLIFFLLFCTRTLLNVFHVKNAVKEQEGFSLGIVVAVEMKNKYTQKKDFGIFDIM